MLKNIALLLLILVFSCKGEPEKPSSQEKTNLPEKSEPKNKTSSLIKVQNLKPGGIISSPLEISGKARGTWFFEASFGIKLYGKDGNEIAFGIAKAQENWMTEDWVPFSATISFQNPESKKGTLVFQKANPSGKAEFDESFEIPVKF